LLVSAAALIVATLTLFSGFGLGTLLMPVFALFFPVEVAVGATAVVHFANNLFKLALVGRWAERSVVLRFGVPAILAAIGGALLLRGLVGIEPITTWQLGARTCEITPVKLVIALLILVFSVLELLERFQSLELPARWLPFGGLLSGFFGGLSGHQGAMRSAFLVRAGLSRDGYVGTAAVCSALVDFTRLGVYAAAAFFGDAGVTQREGDLVRLIAVACIAALAGTILGKKLVQKVTLLTVQRIVAVLLVLLAIALGLGIV
jgi:uncharacterized membrane protein YfcA